MAQERVYAGIDVGATNIKFGLVDAGGKVLFKEQRPTMADKGREPLLHLIANIGERLMLAAAEEDYEVSWIGVATPGSVDTSGTIVGMSPNIKDWKGAPLGSFLSERLNLPVWVDNDVNAMALAECRFGGGVGFDSVVCVTVGTGIGGGIMIDGKLWRGSSHAAGEIGHVPIDLSGPVCGCGQTGCLEVFCSSSAMVNRCREQLKSGLTPGFDAVLNGNIEDLGVRKLFAAARKKDPVALSVIAESARFLAIGLTSAVNILNPSLVIIGGGVADGGAGFVEIVAQELRERVCDSAAGYLRVIKAALGNDAGFVGASILGEGR